MWDRPTAEADTAEEAEAALLALLGNSAQLYAGAVTIEAETYKPDGSTSTLSITHRLNVPNGIETRVAGGALDGARFTHTYTPRGDTTQVDLEGEFPPMPGMSEADQLQMIDGFFTMVFAEDSETLRQWSPEHAFVGRAALPLGF